MPLAPPSKAARGRASQGRKLAFHVPLPAARGAINKMVDETDKYFARIYCKDSVGFFLGLPLANYRKVLAKRPGPVSTIPGVINTVTRAVSDRTSARPYTILLEPGTTVDQGAYNWFAGVGGATAPPSKIEMKTLQFYLPAYMPVWRILDWLAGARDTYIVGPGNSPRLPGMTFFNYGKILALTTPNERTYALESILYRNRVPGPVPGLIDPPVITGP